MFLCPGAVESRGAQPPFKYSTITPIEWRFDRMRIALMLFAATTALCGQDHVSAGAKIFRSHCAECHGLKGEGGRGPNLTTGVFFHGSTDADLMRNVSDGIPGTAMPGVFFSPVQVSHLIAYVRSLSQSSVANQPPGDSVNGAKLFRE